MAFSVCRQTRLVWGSCVVDLSSGYLPVQRVEVCSNPNATSVRNIVSTKFRPVCEIYLLVVCSPWDWISLHQFPSGVRG